MWNKFRTIHIFTTAFVIAGVLFAISGAPSALAAPSMKADAVDGGNGGAVITIDGAEPGSTVCFTSQWTDGFGSGNGDEVCGGTVEDNGSYNGTLTTPAEGLLSWKVTANFKKNGVTLASIPRTVSGLSVKASQDVPCEEGGDCSGGNNGNNGNNGGGNTSGAAGLDCQSQGLQADNGICLPNNPYKGSSGIAGQTKIGDILRIVINILLTLAGVIAVLFIIIGGFQYMTSRGNEEQATKGRKTFVYAIIGLVAVLLSYTIVQIIYNTVVKNSVFS